MKLNEWLQQNFAVTMSSGFFGFFAHCGIAQVLEERKLKPQSASGSSAGALVTGCWAAGLSPEVMREQLFSLKKQDFWDIGPGLGLLKGQLFDAKLRSFIPTTNFAECHFPVMISAYNPLSFRTTVIKSGDLVKAIRASCAVPLMFQPVWIKYRPLLDGGVLDHAGLKGMPTSNRVFYHHLLPRNYKKRHLQKIPTRKNMVTLILTSLPKVGPNRLENGKLAYQHAYQAMQQAMEKSTESGKIII